MFKFNNLFVALISVLLVWHLSTIEGCIHLNDNHFKDVAVLTVSSVSALYLVCFISQKIESSHIGRFLALCGRDSFHIMALHLVGFKIGLVIYNLCFGYVNLATQKPCVGTNYPLVIGLFLFSIFFSLGFMFVFRKIKSLITH